MGSSEDALPIPPEQEEIPSPLVLEDRQKGPEGTRKDCDKHPATTCRGCKQGPKSSQLNPDIAKSNADYDHKKLCQYLK
ncbi:hypothetical protein BTVI_63776 [Pitangus sulphuratus]|nr:hypothetical protein BTVI_63776 [Pitangus sulphuratus]